MPANDFPVAGPDAGHEFPLDLTHSNLAHVPVVVAPGTTDDIIKSGPSVTGQNINPIWQFPTDNRRDAIKAV